MDNVINLAEFRRAKEEAELDEEVTHLRELLDAVLASLPALDMSPMVLPLGDALEPFLTPQTNLSGYEDDTT